MKKLRIKLVLAGLCVLALALLFGNRGFREDEPATRRQSHDGTQQSNHNGSTASSNAPSIAGKSSHKSPTRNAPLSTAPIEAPGSRFDQFKEALEGRNVRMELFGLVLDQYENPVPGVHLKMLTRRWALNISADSLGHSELIEVVSDGNGRFHFKDRIGDSVHLESVYKSGYSVSEKLQRTVRFTEPDAYQPNPLLPFIVRLWKDGEKQPLTGDSKLYGVPPSSNEVTLDLKESRKTLGRVNEGDLWVQIIRPEKVEPRTKYDWSLKIEAIGGGVMETSDPYMKLAPQAGYTNPLVVAFRGSDDRWADVVRKELFFTTRNGQIYGKMKVEVYAAYNDQSAIQIEYSLNPTGNRSLE